ncbi:hypothetical protein BX659_104153 [Orenia metallireducens]|uniref:serine/threonine protein kinase n=1 Tax=Orenia metallireducens TaxID=1413210 RepID=UPI000D052F4D|nr:serine/threonine protein kinase [Orenia metallireducens]PRX32604.1 hypothetical protein BX659_104153 [Orenia metallireducens]
MIGEQIKIEGQEFMIDKLLGKGKSGYSYLITNGQKNLVLKKIHHEPCSYYNFEGSKLKCELNAYHVLKEFIRVPRLIDYNHEEEYLIKEYIDGPTAAELIANSSLEEYHVMEIFNISKLLKEEGINIDYFPTNFVIKDDKLIYVDYEFNDYMEEWDLINWGAYYWANSEGMKEYLDTGNIAKLNQDVNLGIPKKKEFEEQVAKWIKGYNI